MLNKICNRIYKYQTGALFRRVFYDEINDDTFLIAETADESLDFVNCIVNGDRENPDSVREEALGALIADLKNKQTELVLDRLIKLQKNVKLYMDVKVKFNGDVDEQNTIGNLVKLENRYYVNLYNFCLEDVVNIQHDSIPTIICYKD